MLNLNTIKKAISENTEIGKTPGISRKLPKLSNTFTSSKLPAHDRLYYGSKKSKKYGKIPNLLRELVGKLPNEAHQASSQKKRRLYHHEEKEKYDNILVRKKLPRAELIDIKRQIFLSQLSIDMKQESIQNFKDAIHNQEIELQEQLKKNKETRDTMQQFLKEQQIMLQNLKDKSVRIESENYEKTKELARINNQIQAINNDLKQMGVELGIYKEYKDFIESICGLKMIDKVSEIQEHNKKVEEQQSRRIERQTRIEQLEQQLASFSRGGGSTTKFFLTNTNQIATSGKKSPPSFNKLGEAFKKVGAKERYEKLEQRLRDLELQQDTEQDIAPKTILDHITEEKFVEFMYKLEEDDLHLIQVLQGLEEEIAYFDAQIARLEKDAENKLSAVTTNINDIHKKKVNFFKDRQKLLSMANLSDTHLSSSKVSGGRSRSLADTSKLKDSGHSKGNRSDLRSPKSNLSGSKFGLSKTPRLIQKIKREVKGPTRDAQLFDDYSENKEIVLRAIRKVADEFSLNPKSKFATAKKIDFESCLEDLKNLQYMAKHVIQNYHLLKNKHKKRYDFAQRQLNNLKRDARDEGLRRDQLRKMMERERIKKQKAEDKKNNRTRKVMGRMFLKDDYDQEDGGEEEEIDEDEKYLK